MASSMTDFLQTFLNLKQVQNQTEQIAQRAKTDVVSGLTTFMDLAKHTADPGARQALVQRFSSLGVASPEQLSAIQYHVAPSMDAQKETMMQAGVDKMTPENADRLAGETANIAFTGHDAGQLASSSFLKSVFEKTGDITKNHQDFMDKLAIGLGTRTAAGQDAGAFTLAAATAALPTGTVTRQANIAGGTDMSDSARAADQVARGGLALGGAQLTETARNNSLDAMYKNGMLAVEQSRAAMSGMGAGREQVAKILESKVQVLSALTAAKQKDPTGSTIQGFIGALNGINQQLEALGVRQEGTLDYNVDELLKPGFFSRNTSKGPTNAANRQPPPKK